MTTTSATQLLRGLSSDEIRQRLAAIGAEEKALRTLLRAALALERGKADGKGADRA